MTEASTKTRSSRRGQRKRNRNAADPKLEQIEWQELVNPHPPIQILPPEDLDKIHDASMKVLSEIGIRFLDPRERSECSGSSLRAAPC